MRVVTLEVVIANGRIIPRNPEALPIRGSGYLTLVQDAESAPQPGNIAKFLVLWTGAFQGQETSSSDPRLDYLTAKHLK